jgi:HlyD family secretion protein
MVRTQLAFIVTLTLVLAGCGAKKDPADKVSAEKAGDEKKASEEPAAAAAPVEVAKAELATIHQGVKADAILYPINQAGVTAKISAPIKRFFVNRGDHVQLGQLLAVLENKDLEASLAENRQLVAQAQAAYQSATGAQMPDDLTKAKSDVQSARQTLDAAQKLYDNRMELQKQGALAQKLVDDAKVALVQAQSQLETARQHLTSLQTVGRGEQTKSLQAQLDAAKARYENALAQLSYSEIRSPIAGIVADRPLYAGEMAQSGAPIITVVDISEVVARANIGVKEAANIRVGRPATVNGPGGEVKGKVTVVSPAVNPNTTTVEIWIQAQNPGEKLKPGTTVHVAIAVEEIKNAVVVPVSALLAFDEGGEKVMVVGSDSLAHEHKVEVGAREGDKVQILSGVKAGDMVITVGGLGLDDKAKVTTTKPEPEEKDKAEDPKK